MCTLVIHAAPGPVCAGSYCYNNGTCNATGTGCDCPEPFLQPYCIYRDCEYSILDYSKSCQLSFKSSASTYILLCNQTQFPLNILLVSKKDTNRIEFNTYLGIAI